MGDVSIQYGTIENNTSRMSNLQSLENFDSEGDPGSE